MIEQFVSLFRPPESLIVSGKLAAPDGSPRTRSLIAACGMFLSPGLSLPYGVCSPAFTWRIGGQIAIIGRSAAECCHHDHNYRKNALEQLPH